MLDGPFSRASNPHPTHIRTDCTQKKRTFGLRKTNHSIVQHISRCRKMPDEDGANNFGMRAHVVRFWALTAVAAPYIHEKIPSRSLNIFTVKLNNIPCAFHRARLLLFYDAIKITFEIFALVLQRQQQQRTAYGEANNKSEAPNETSSDFSFSLRSSHFENAGRID